MSDSQLQDLRSPSWSQIHTLVIGKLQMCRGAGGSSEVCKGVPL